MRYLLLPARRTTATLIIVRMIMPAINMMRIPLSSAGPPVVGSSAGVAVKSMVAVGIGVSFGCFCGGGVCVGVWIGVLVGTGVGVGGIGVLVGTGVDVGTGVLAGVGVKPANAGVVCQVVAAKATKLKTKAPVMILLSINSISLYETIRGSYRAPS